MDIYLILICIMSIITLILYFVDKSRAKRNKWHIKEKTLLLSAFFFGSVGAVLGMVLAHHKTKHWYFLVINYGSLIIHIVVGYLLYESGFYLFK